MRKQISVIPKGDFPAKAKLGETLDGLVLVVDESRCTGCGECYDVCPQGVIQPHPERKVALKCDLCDGEPQCIAFCQNSHVLAVDLKLDRADRVLATASAHSLPHVAPQ